MENVHPDIFLMLEFLGIVHREGGDVEVEFVGVGDDAFGGEGDEGADAVGAEFMGAFEGEDRPGPGDFDNQVGPALFEGAAEIFIVSSHDHAVPHLRLIEERDQAGAQVRWRRLHVQVNGEAGVMGQL